MLGIGGDTTMLLGNQSEFSYQGCDFSVSRGRTNPPMTCNYADEQLATLGLNNWKPNIYNAPVYAVMLGTLALFTGALVLQFIFKAGLSGNPASSKAEKLAAEIIPGCEASWLWVVKYLEYIGSTIIPIVSESSTGGELAAINNQIAQIEERITTAKATLIIQKNSLVT